MSLPVDDTIAAISTPLFPSGIGVIRISGPDAYKITDSIFEGTGIPSSRDSYSALHGYVQDPQTGVQIDEVVCLVMKGPNTYTGEDVVELSAHGSPFLLQEIIKVIIANGARQAEPGEFTYRAFINGKMSLTQAEAVHQLIHARSETGLRNAFLQLQGSLQKRIQRLCNSAVELLSDFEAEIEFPEEGLSFISKKDATLRLKLLIKGCSELASSYTIGKKIEEGVTITLCGPPNSGKSTLLNRLLNKDRAIVHYEPGTTRDVIEETVVINGATLRLVDTAGIRDTDESVEEHGIKKTYSVLKKSDLVIWIDSVSEKDTTNDFLFQKVHSYIHDHSKHIQVLRLLNKSDLLKNDQRKQLVDECSNGTQCVVSAKRGWGISQLRNTISDCIGKLHVPIYEGTIVTSMRQRQLLDAAKDALKRVLNGLQNNISLEYLCIDLQEGIEGLNQFIGKNPPQDIYKIIFSNYCVGK